MIPKIQDVLPVFRRRSLPVFHVLRVHRPDWFGCGDHPEGLFYKHPFAVAGTLGAAVIQELAPCKGEYVLTKTRMSAFIGTELDLMLRTLGVTNLVVCGIQTPNCIRTTVFDGIVYNYPVILVDDATGAASEEVHMANIRDMQNIGVKVVKAADLMGVLDAR